MSRPSPPRILLHPGFHKTGTSSIQHFLWHNRAAMAPSVSLLLLRNLKEVARRCMSYSVTQNPLILAELVETMEAALDAAPPTPGTDLVISCEALSGHCPGWKHVVDYTAAPVTAAFLSGYLAEVFPDSDISIVYTTRDRERWLWSVWRHHLMGQRLTEDWPDFAARLAGVDLDSVMSGIAGELAHVAVYALPLEEARLHPLGPGGSLLELLALPDAVMAALEPVAPANPGPDAELAARLLDINCSTLPDAAVIAQKRTLAEAAGIGGWKG